MKKYFHIVVITYLINIFLFSEKLIIPNKTKFTESLTKETFISNLTDLEIFQPLDFQIINDFIIIGNGKPVEMVKLNLSGKVLIRSGNKEGKGPGEFLFCIAPRKVENNIVFVDLSNKILFYDFNLNFIKEIKFPIIARDFLYMDNKYLIFPENSGSDFYLGKYSLNGDLKNKFGGKYISRKDELFYLNKPFLLAYDKIRKIIWVAMANRYELKSYYKEILKDEIRAESDFFEKFKVIDEQTGEKETKLDGKGIKLVLFNNNLSYFFKKKDNCYCDVFDLKDFTHLKRYKLKVDYKLISYQKGNVFYGISFNDEGDSVLSKFEISE